jgi:molecular chaperone IbpA
LNLYQKQIGEKGFDGDYVLQLALAGYSAEDIQVSLAKNVLTIESAGAAEDSQNYLHKGIAKRAFKVSFPVADGVVVKSAEMNNGLLEVTLSVELPKDEIKKIPVLSK